MEQNTGVRILPVEGNAIAYMLLLMRLGKPTRIYVCDCCGVNLTKEEMCGTTFLWNNTPYTCTQRVGHEGDCMACGILEDEHPVIRWAKKDALTPEKAVERLLHVSEHLNGQSSEATTNMLMSFVGLFVVLHKNNEKSYNKLERCYPPKGCKIQARVFLHNGDMVELRSDDVGKPLFFVKQTDKAIVVIRDPEYMGDAVYREEVKVASDELGE